MSEQGAKYGRDGYEVIEGDKVESDVRELTPQEELAQAISLLEAEQKLLLEALLNDGGEEDAVRGLIRSVKVQMGEVAYLSDVVRVMGHKFEGALS